MCNSSGLDGQVLDLTLLKHLDIFVPILTMQTNEYFHFAIPYCIYKKEFTVHISISILKI